MEALWDGFLDLLPGNWELWAYGGGFHFDADGYDNVTGPRGRVELSYNNVPYLGDGSKFTVGLESQTDNVRGGQSWGSVRPRPLRGCPRMPRRSRRRSST